MSAATMIVDEDETHIENIQWGGHDETDETWVTYYETWNRYISRGQFAFYQDIDDNGQTIYVKEKNRISTKDYNMLYVHKSNDTFSLIRIENDTLYYSYDRAARERHQNAQAAVNDEWSNWDRRETNRKFGRLHDQYHTDRRGVHDEPKRRTCPSVVEQPDPNSTDFRHRGRPSFRQLIDTDARKITNTINLPNPCRSIK